MKKNILIPTDFSKNSWNALHYAITLFKDEECSFFILNAFQLFHYPTDNPEEPNPGEEKYEKAREESKNGLEKLVKNIRPTRENPMHNFEIISLYNSVLGAIKETVEDKHISLIIMGTKGNGNPMNVVYGNNAVNVMEKMKKCPVLVVPETAKIPEGELREIVFATNYKFYYKRRELAPLVAIAEKFSSKICILFVGENEKLSEEQEANKEILKDYLEGCLYSFHAITNFKVAVGIHSFIESRASNMLALYNRNHGFFSGMFAKSLVKELSNSPHVPILILQEHK